MKTPNGLFATICMLVGVIILPWLYADPYPFNRLGHAIILEIMACYFMLRKIDERQSGERK